MINVVKTPRKPPNDTLDPSFLEGLPDDEAETLIRKEFAANSKTVAQELLEEDPESVFGLEMFQAFLPSNSPNEDVVRKERRRGYGYELRAKRVKRLAELMLDLTPFQERFVHHYVQKKWDSYADIAIFAGSTAVKSHSLRNVAFQALKNKRVIEAIGLLTWTKLEAEGVDRNEVITMFRNNHAVAMATEDLKEANVAAEKLGMIVGLFPSKGSTAVTRHMTQMEQGQLKELQEVNKRSGGNVNYGGKETADAEGGSDASDSAMAREDLLEALKVAKTTRAMN